MWSLIPVNQEVPHFRGKVVSSECKLLDDLVPAGVGEQESQGFPRLSEWLTYVLIQSTKGEKNLLHSSLLLLHCLFPFMPRIPLRDCVA